VLRVGIDVAGALAPETGIGRYTRALYRALTALEDLEMVPFCNSRRQNPSLDPGGVVINPRWPGRVLRAAWHRLHWPPVERYTGSLGVFHTSDWSHPPLRAGARVTTVHDLGSLVHPQWYTDAITAHHAKQNRSTCRLSDRVIAISEFTRATFLERYSISPERVVVVPNGVDPLFAPAPSVVVSDVRQRHGLDAPYLLYVGTRERRKNLMGLVDIFARIAEDTPELRLAVVGARPWLEARAVHGSRRWSGREVEDRIRSLGLEDRVTILGAVPLADLIALYSGAELFVFPTLYEGFGLPVLEAMSCGCPVVASSLTAVPEVVGNAGLLVDPDDVDAFAQCAKDILTDSQFRSELVSRGKERARAFTWARTAERTAAVYRSAVTA